MERLIGLAIGIFIGNMCFHGLIHKNWKSGFWVGTFAGILCILIYATVYLVQYIIMCHDINY